jgi:hypothetical protein
MNNPLSLTDPTGYASTWVRNRATVVGIVVAIASYGTMTQFAMAYGATSFATAAGQLTFTGVVASGAAGFASRVATYKARSKERSRARHFAEAWKTMSVAEKFGNVAGHAVVGCAQAAASGGSCKSGALGSGFSSRRREWLR